jgi:ABC-2 type transport system permease protein
MVRRLWALIVKESVQLVRDRRLLALLAGLPLLWLIVFGYAARFEVQPGAVGVADLSDTLESVRLVSALKTGAALPVYNGYHSREELRLGLDRGEIRFGLIIPAGFSVANPAEVELLADGSDLLSAQAGLRTLVPALSGGGGGVVPPRVEVLYNPQVRSSAVMIPALAGLVIMFAITLLAALSLVQEQEQGTLEQIAVSPVTPLELVLGKLIPFMLAGLIDLALLLLTGVYLFDIPLAGSPLLFFGLGALFLLAALGLGLLISALAKSQQQATLMALFALVPQILLSGLIFPLSAMPVAARYIAYLFPLTYFTPIARGIWLKGVGLDVLLQPALLLGIYGLAMVALATARLGRRAAL